MSGDDKNTTEYCMFCGRSSETAGKMIMMPPGFKLCADCMNKMVEQAQQFDAGNMQELMQDPTLAGLFSALTGGTEPGMPEKQDMPAGRDPGAEDNSREDYREVTESDRKESQPGFLREESDGSLKDAVHAEEEKPENDGDADQPEEPPKKDPEKKADDKASSGGRTTRRPTISFLNLADIMNGGMGAKRPARKVKKQGPPPIFTSENMPAPHKIKAELDKYVIGQEQAKKIISVAAYNHYKRVNHQAEAEGIEIEKSNILLIGPTGSGKTYLVKTLARILDVPLAITDATSLTEAGYIGDDIESVVSKLLDAADQDIEKTERGIIFIDEIDKIAKKKNSHARDVSGEAVQQGMLKLLEGAEVEVPVGAGSKNSMVPMVTVNTENILFICGGAFPELENIIAKRLMKKTSLGFGAVLKDDITSDKDLLSKVTTEDLREFGMIPEFLGRLPITCLLQKLDEDMMVQILTEPRNAILKQYQKLLALDEVRLEFEEDALRAIARKAMEKDTGARALRSIIEEFMMDIMYEVPKDDNIGTVTITPEYVEGKGGPRIQIRTDLPRTEAPRLEAHELPDLPEQESV